MLDHLALGGIWLGENPETIKRKRGGGIPPKAVFTEWKFPKAIVKECQNVVCSLPLSILAHLRTLS